MRILTFVPKIAEIVKFVNYWEKKMPLLVYLTFKFLNYGVYMVL